MITLDMSKPMVDEDGNIVIGKTTNGKEIVITKTNYDDFMVEVLYEIKRNIITKLDVDLGPDYTNIGEYMENDKVDLNKYAEYILAEKIENLIRKQRHCLE